MRRFLPFFALLIIPIAAVAYVVLSSDGDGNDGGGPVPDAAGNLIANGDFEDGDGPCTSEEGQTIACWYSLRDPDWELTDEKAHTGSHSAKLSMRDTAQSEETKIYYLVQEFDLGPDGELPEVISGNYYVENWLRGTKNQYMQFVVILWGDDFSNMPLCPQEEFCPNYQIRYLLAGIQEDPFGIANAQFYYVTKEDPVEGEWVHFEQNLHDDFEQYWGAIPHDITRVRLLFEVRYDAKAADEGPLEADVYYDDLYLGSAEDTP
jgi:hypothetical protein